MRGQPPDTASMNFDSPRDAIVWDTGHQSYVHKMLTGRQDRFDVLRTADGLSGFRIAAP